MVTLVRLANKTKKKFVSRWKKLRPASGVLRIHNEIDLVEGGDDGDANANDNDDIFLEPEMRHSPEEAAPDEVWDPQRIRPGSAPAAAFYWPWYSPAVVVMYPVDAAFYQMVPP